MWSLRALRSLTTIERCVRVDFMGSVRCRLVSFANARLRPVQNFREKPANSARCRGRTGADDGFRELSCGHRLIQPRLRHAGNTLDLLAWDEDDLAMKVHAIVCIDCMLIHCFSLRGDTACLCPACAIRSSRTLYAEVNSGNTGSRHAVS